MPWLHEMLNQILTYDGFDYLTIATLIVLEGLLSVDNALVLATLVKKLPKSEQHKALTYGVWGAIVFRLLAIVLATQLIKISWIKLIGGAYLIYLAFKHMFPSGKMYSERDHECKKEAPHISFWGTVILVELTDIVFSIDSITTAVAMTEKMTVIMFGGVAGLLAMRFVAMIFIKLLEKFPRLDDIAYQLIFFVGIKLSLGYFNFEMDHRTFWLVIGFIVLVGISSMYQARVNSGKEAKSTTSLITSHNEEFIVDISKEKISIVDLFESDNQFSSDFIRYLIKNGYLSYTRRAFLPNLKRASQKLYDKNAPTTGEIEDSAEVPHQSIPESPAESPEHAPQGKEQSGDHGSLRSPLE